jgi:hypothetical protein
VGIGQVKLVFVVVGGCPSCDLTLVTGEEPGGVVGGSDSIAELLGSAPPDELVVAVVSSNGRSGVLGADKVTWIVGGSGNIEDSTVNFNPRHNVGRGALNVLKRFALGQDPFNPLATGSQNGTNLSVTTLGSGITFVINSVGWLSNVAIEPLVVTNEVAEFWVNKFRTSRGSELGQRPATFAVGCEGIKLAEGFKETGVHIVLVNLSEAIALDVAVLALEIIENNGGNVNWGLVSNLLPKRVAEGRIVPAAFTGRGSINALVGKHVMLAHGHVAVHVFEVTLVVCHFDYLGCR